MGFDKEIIFKQISYLAQERDRTDILLRMVIKSAYDSGISIEEISINTTLSYRDADGMLYE